MNFKEINGFIKSARIAQNDLDAAVSTARDKLLTNLEYERAGEEAPFDPVAIHAGLNALRANLKAARAAVPDEVVTFPPALLSVFPEWTRDSHYTAGERCRHDGMLYRALANVKAGNAAPSADSELWEEVKSEEAV